jgi:hypothetical protein
VIVSALIVSSALAAGSPAAAQRPVSPLPSQQPPAQPPAQPPGAPGQPAAQTPAVPTTRRFTSDAGMVFSVIKADKTADFEGIVARVKEALSKSSDPKRKQMALSWRVFKGLETAAGGNFVYVWFLDPPVKDVDYTVTEILRDAFPNEAQDLWAKYVACFVSGQTMLNLELKLNMNPNAGPPK